MAIALLPLALHSPPEIGIAGINLLGQRDDRIFHAGDRWSLHLVRWNGTYVIDGARLTVSPGMAVLIPPRAAHRLLMPDRAETLYVQFNLPVRGPTVKIPQVSDLADRFAPTWLALHELVDWHERLPVRASARLWEELWSLTGDAGQHRHPIVEQACVLVRWNLHEAISVAWIANRCGVSHNRLTRLFRQVLGTTVAAYIATQRLDQARFLLTQTAHPISEVAIAVGIPDQRYLSRLVKRRWGVTPRELRLGAG
jgi:AraC-like DNA-binding protein